MASRAIVSAAALLDESTQVSPRISDLQAKTSSLSITSTLGPKHILWVITHITLKARLFHETRCNFQAISHRGSRLFRYVS